mmetsp:Transcript_111977/g.311776  ORF Transcript_111977/g.311776 Transcript_111977/m.311776 type:complete len:443 (+) Transcript_111977:90-1418(+)
MSCGSSDLTPAMFSSMPDETEGWRNPTTFSGDFYREPDNVVRGMSLAQASLGVSGASSFKGVLGGDFYSEPDDVFRGISMRADAHAGLLRGSPGFHESLNMLPECLGKLEPGLSCKAQHQSGCVFSGVERFTEGDVPPSVPADPFFKLEVTTIHVSSSTPWDIGNNLLDFLNTKVVSSITKVSTLKFAIKADVLAESSSCALKVRTYREERERYAVEFQRRSGDSVTFNQTFQQARKFLSPHFTPVTIMPAVSRDFDHPQLKRPVVKETEGEITPLLDMAGLVDLPLLQAECAVALAQVAQDTRVAASLCTSHAFEEFKKLLQTNQTEVAYPTARMLLLLAQCPEAVPRFADEALLSLLLGKVQSKTTSALVQQQLAQVLNAAITRCAAKLSRKVSDGIMSELAKAIKDIDVVDTPTSRNLKEAQLVLQFQRADYTAASGWS